MTLEADVIYSILHSFGIQGNRELAGAESFLSMCSDKTSGLPSATKRVVNLSHKIVFCIIIIVVVLLI